MSSEIETLQEWSTVWTKDGNRYFTKQRDYVRMIKEVVETTAKVLRSKEVLFEVDQVRGRPVVRATKLGKAFFRCIKVDTRGIARQFPRHRFSPFYLAFDKYCEGLWCGEDEIDTYMAKALNDAIANIREYGNVGGLRKQLENLRRSERSNAGLLHGIPSGQATR